MIKSRLLLILIAGSLIASGAAIGGYFYHIPARSPLELSGPPIPQLRAFATL